MTDEDLAEAVGKVDVFARTTPDHKLRNRNSFTEKEKSAGMTGDGVNGRRH